eukprot:CAMPEP_0115317354 /NCGR_PEP_ID=MMETSP0270-20121206/78611_1 /TAXON_ID=71861 /ORGANISM="Scrippsiella trochoidea, Strain CCMP3099" /LENGTH=1642 /DNA_ID=CAMNT_0002736821 /DNA_START=42 /DNA_END=4970 /DNA_ORIENTATION=+
MVGRFWDYAPMAEPASLQLRPDGLPEPTSLEEGPLSPGAFTARTVRQRRWQPLRVAALVAVACAALLLALTATQRLHDTAMPAAPPSSRLEVEELWLTRDIILGCPPVPKLAGGVPRTRKFITIAQAFICLDLNNNSLIEMQEFGPGAAVTTVDWVEFREHIRQNRDLVLAGLPHEAVGVKKWTELVLKILPSGSEAATVSYSAAPSFTAPTGKIVNPGLLAPAGASAATDAPAVAPVVTPAIAPTAAPLRQESTIVPGKVGALYTFGAPAVSRTGMLKNKAREDGCFPGLRVYTRGSHRVEDYQIRFEVADPITYIMSAMGYSHAHSAVLSLDEDNVLHSGFSDCGSGWSGPKADLFFWFQGHTNTIYERTVNELASLLAATNWHEETPESDVKATMIDELKGSSNATCSAHPACVLHATVNASALCCPTESGFTRFCCSEKSSATNKFDVNAPMAIHDYVRLSSNETEVKDAFEQIVYYWRDGMEDMLGQVFPIIKIASPGIVALPSADGSNGGVWEFPTSVVHKVPPEVSNRYRAQKEAPVSDGLAATTAAPVPKQAASTSATPASPMAAAAAGAAEPDPANMGKRDLISHAAVYQHLADISYASEDMKEVVDAEDFGFKLVSHAMPPRNETGLSPMMSLFQDPISHECVAAFANRRPKLMETQADYLVKAEFFKLNPHASSSFFSWWEMLAGFTPERYQHHKWLWTNNANSFSRPISYAYLKAGHTVVDKNGHCTLVTETGSAPCPENMTEWREEQDQLKGMSHITRTRDWCGISGVQVYMAEALANFSGSDVYKLDITSKLPNCRSVTALGYDLGGAFATLWSACVNSGLQPGDAGYEDYREVMWQAGQPDNLHGYIPSSEATDVFMLRNKKTGKVLDLAGDLEKVELGSGKLVLQSPYKDAVEQNWVLTPAGFLRNKRSNKCLGVSGHLGSTNPEENVGKHADIEDCQYGLVSTAQAWNFTSRGFLVNQYSGLCLSAEMTLIKCPLSDQVWHMRSDGFILNQLSGQCLDIEGNPGTANGAAAVIWPCEYTNTDTDQRWERTEHGFVRNLQSGKCLDVKQLHGVKTDPQLVLWDCVETLAGDPVAQRWRFTKEGYMVNSLTGKCVDVIGSSQTEQGSPLRLWSCENYHLFGPAAVWELQDGKIINRGSNRKYRGLCIGANADDTAPEATLCETEARHSWRVNKEGHLEPAMGVDKCISQHNGEVTLEDCVSGKRTMQHRWSLTSEGFLVNNKTGMCLDVAEDGINVREGHCHITDQRWTFQDNGQIKGMLSGRCIDVKGSPPSNLENDVELNLWDCASVAATSDQAWQFLDNGMIKNQLSGKCVDIRGVGADHEENGARLVINNCSEGKLAQRWYKTSKGFLKSRVNHKCIDVNGPAGHTDGQVLVIFTCEDDAMYTDETWELVGSDGQVAQAQQALKPPSGMKLAFKSDETVPKALVQAGEFMTYGRDVYWTYRGFKHLVPPLEDCSKCNCKNRVVRMDQLTIEALPTGKEYDCTLQGLADEQEGFKSLGLAGITSEQQTPNYPDSVGRFISKGAEVYWEYDGRKHLVPPGIGCDKCGCQGNVVVVNQEYLASVSEGIAFNCVMKKLVEYGVNFGYDVAPTATPPAVATAAPVAAIASAVGAATPVAATVPAAAVA